MILHKKGQSKDTTGVEHDEDQANAEAAAKKTILWVPY